MKLKTVLKVINKYNVAFNTGIASIISLNEIIVISPFYEQGTNHLTSHPVLFSA